MCKSCLASIIYTPPMGSKSHLHFSGYLRGHLVVSVGNGGHDKHEDAQLDTDDHAGSGGKQAIARHLEASEPLLPDA